MDNPTTLYVYTDGSSDRDGYGGYAYVITDGITDQHNIIADMRCGALKTTNNRMELKAVIEGLRTCCRLYFIQDVKVIEVFSDSAYVINCFKDKWYRSWLNNNWVGSAGPVKNVDLWKELLQLVNDILGAGYDIQWNHIRGHQDNHWNNRCDILAGAARKSTKEAGRVI